MAGSYNHCIDENGNLLDAHRLADMLENGGDVYEAVEELYGMVWWLADWHDHLDPRDAVSMAQGEYRKGLEVSRRENRQ